MLPPPNGPNDEELVFFLDHNFGRHIVATALREAGARCEVHTDHFPENATDEEWLTAVGARGWYIFTKDKHIGTRAHELAALRQAEAGVFLVVAKDMTGPEIAALLVSFLPKISIFCTENSKPFIVKLYKNGQMRKWR